MTACAYPWSEVTHNFIHFVAIKGEQHQQSIIAVVLAILLEMLFTHAELCYIISIFLNIAKFSEIVIAVVQ